MKVVFEEKKQSLSLCIENTTINLAAATKTMHGIGVACKQHLYTILLAYKRGYV